MGIARSVYAKIKNYSMGIAEKRSAALRSPPSPKRARCDVDEKSNEGAVAKRQRLDLLLPVQNEIAADSEIQQASTQSIAFKFSSPPTEYSPEIFAANTPRVLSPSSSSSSSSFESLSPMTSSDARKNKKYKDAEKSMAALRRLLKKKLAERVIKKTNTTSRIRTKTLRNAARIVVDHLSSPSKPSTSGSTQDLTEESGYNTEEEPDNAQKEDSLEEETCNDEKETDSAKKQTDGIEEVDGVDKENGDVRLLAGDAELKVDDADLKVDDAKLEVDDAELKIDDAELKVDIAKSATTTMSRVYTDLDRLRFFDTDFPNYARNEVMNGKQKDGEIATLMDYEYDALFAQAVFGKPLQIQSDYQ